MCISEVVPMYVGYALGDIIKKEDLMLPMKIKESEAILKQLENEQNKLNQIDRIKANQFAINNQNARISAINKKLNLINDKIQKLAESASEFAIEEMLPIDRTQELNLKTKNTTFESERTSHYWFDSAGFEKDGLHGRVERFIADLFLDDTSSAILPSGTLDTLVRKIEGFRNSEYGVSLVGSFITLNRVRTIDPIRLRQNALSKKLRANASKYRVLTGAVLGAVLLGVGKWMTIERPSSIDLTKIDTTKISMFSFISQGAIPKIDKQLEEMNLWSLYLAWKQKLEENDGTGYPIRFKFRKLKDICRENDIPTGQIEKKHDEKV